MICPVPILINRVIVHSERNASTLWTFKSPGRTSLATGSTTEPTSGEHIPSQIYVFLFIRKIAIFRHKLLNRFGVFFTIMFQGMHCFTLRCPGRRPRRGQCFTRGTIGQELKNTQRDVIRIHSYLQCGQQNQTFSTYSKVVQVLQFKLM